MTEWLDFDIFTVHLANRIRRKAGDPNRELSVRIFADIYNLSEGHILAVLDRVEEPSKELLAAVGAEEAEVSPEVTVRRKKVYRFK